MAITISISHDAPAADFKRVEDLAAEVSLRDVNFNGDDIRVERGDFTCVDDADEVRGTQLLQRVYAAIEGE